MNLIQKWPYPTAKCCMHIVLRVYSLFASKTESERIITLESRIKIQSFKVILMNLWNGLLKKQDDLNR